MDFIKEKIRVMTHKLEALKSIEKRVLERVRKEQSL